MVAASTLAGALRAARGGLPSRLAALVLAVLVLAVPALADPAPPTVRFEQAYFTCAEGTTKVQNVNQAQGQPAGWALEAPTESVQDGAGCGTADSPVAGGATANPHDAVWEDTFTGNLEALEIEAHAIDTAGRAADNQRVKTQIYVDGELIIDTGFVSQPVTRSDTQASVSMTIRLDGLPLKTEPGVGSTERTITVVIGTPFGASVGAGFVNAWVWGTTEVPAGITFNPDAPTS